MLRIWPWAYPYIYTVIHERLIARAVIREKWPEVKWPEKYI